MDIPGSRFEGNFKEVNKKMIIEAKVSLIKRTIEIMITVMLNLLVIWFLSLLLDSIYATIIGNYILYPWMPYFVTNIKWLGILSVILLLFFFFALASSWQFFKSALYPAKDQKADEPASVTNIELSEYFQIPLTEIQRRQNADELIIYENINNERIKELRAIHDKKQ